MPFALPDTNVVVARIREDDKFNSVACERLKKIFPDDVHLLLKVFKESGRLFQKNADAANKDLRKAIDEFCQERKIKKNELDHRHIDYVIDKAFEYRKKNKGFYEYIKYQTEVYTKGGENPFNHLFSIVLTVATQNEITLMKSNFFIRNPDVDCLCPSNDSETALVKRLHADLKKSSQFFHNGINNSDRNIFVDMLSISPRSSMRDYIFLTTDTKFSEAIDSISDYLAEAYDGDIHLPKKELLGQ